MEPRHRVRHNSAGLTSLMVACREELEHDVRSIVSKKPDAVNQRDRSGKTALHYCAENNITGCAEHILSSNAQLLNVQDDEGYSPLHLAVISGNKTMVRFLIDQGANINCMDTEKHSCVHWATVCGELECLDLLGEAGADHCTPDIHGAYPVHYAAQMCGPNSEMGNNVRLGLAVLQKLISRGVDVNCTDQDGRQPLLWAASAETRASKTYCPSGSSDAILTLVRAGADVTAEDKDGLTALHCAASRGHLDCLETLITLCGADVDVLDSNCCSPLFYAVTLGHADCTHLLLGFGAQPNLQDRKGRTAAHCGASKGQLETLRILGQHRANLWMRNVRGDMPLHEAVQSARKELVEWLLEQQQGSVNATNSNGRTPLHIAAITNNIEMCKVLMDHGAFVNPIMKNSKGQLLTPLDAALHRSNRGCAKYLQLHGALPASKIVERKEIIRPSAVDVAQTGTASPEPKRRVFRESAVQTETLRRDVDIQVHLGRRTEQGILEVGDMINERQTDERRTVRGTEGRKPIVAKVYVHTKRKERRSSRRGNDGNRKECSGERHEDRSRRGSRIPRFADDGLCCKQKSQAQDNGDTGAKNTINVNEKPMAVSGAELENVTIEQEQDTEFVSLPKDEEANVQYTKDMDVHKEIDGDQHNCCNTPYADKTMIFINCSCSCHKRKESILEVVTQETNNDHHDCCDAPFQDGVTIQTSCRCGCHSRKISLDQIETPQTNNDHDCCNAPYQDKASIQTSCSCACHRRSESHEDTETQQDLIQERRLTVDFDDHSPLSSIRSIESNVKDSGFSDDFDRDASSETEESRISPKCRTRRRPIARFVVSSGAADTFHLEEDETGGKGTPRSASMPTLQERDEPKENYSRFLSRSTLTKEVQKSLRKYQLERRLFYELQELKRQQICGKSHTMEGPTVQKMVERFRRHVLSPGMTDFKGSFTFQSFEKYLYEQLRNLSMSCKIPKPKIPVDYSLRSYATQMDAPTKPPICVCQTQSCHHSRQPYRDLRQLSKSQDGDSMRTVLPQIPAHQRRIPSKIPVNRSQSWDRLENSKKDSQVNGGPIKFNNSISKSLPALTIPLPRRIPASLLAAIGHRLGPDVHLDDTVIVEMSAADMPNKVRHAFTVREIREAVRQWEEVAGRKLKPLALEKVLDPDEDGPVTFEIRHGRERNLFRLPAEKLKDNKKWQVIFTIGKEQKNMSII